VAEASTRRLVLLPGLDGTGLLFGPLLEALPPDIDATVVSYPAEVFLPRRDLADLVAEELSRGGDTVILAESYSGLICLELLQRRLSEIRGVIFVACFASPPRPLLIRLLRLLPLVPLLHCPPPSWLVEWFCLGPGADSARLRLLRHALSKVRPSVLAERLKDLGEAASWTGRIDLPACYLQAAADRLVPDRSAEAFKAMAPDIEVYHVDGPHFLLQTNPVDCAKAIDDFFRRQVPFASVPGSQGPE
jgi:pimeloyl-ACP methyl ester carboxylesterase